MNFDATTWREAERLAEEYMMSEAKKLLDAIEARKQALIDADK